MTFSTLFQFLLVGGAGVWLAKAMGFKLPSRSADTDAIHKALAEYEGLKRKETKPEIVTNPDGTFTFKPPAK